MEEFLEKVIKAAEWYRKGAVTQGEFELDLFLFASDWYDEMFPSDYPQPVASVTSIDGIILS